MSSSFPASSKPEAPRRVAFVHYHLRGGGVTRVLEHQQAVLHKAGMASAILIGEAPPPDLPHKDIAVIDGLGYDGTFAARSFDSILQDLRAAARRLLGGEPDLWHIHNSALGKNETLPRLVRRLADDGEAVLLQPHDFAEDGRPGNYGFLRERLGPDLARTLHPAGGRVHYATINRRDGGFLVRAGLDAARLHPLSNPVAFDREALLAAEPAQVDDRPLWLYPTRGIRRKNVGEVLLWAACGAGERLYGLTLAPQNPREQPRYRAWVQLSERLRLPVRFELGAAYPFLSLLRGAEALLTTSVAEGFGLAFLEPALLDKPLRGRALPEITAEFAEAGADLRPLYERVEVPLAWVGAEGLRERIGTRLGAALASYGHALTDADVDAAWTAAVQGDRVDFGHLDEDLQARVIERCAGDAGCRDEVLPSDPLLEPVSPARLAANRRLVEDRYSLDAYGQRLLAAYDRTLNDPATPLAALNAQRLLDCYLDPHRFMLLRS